MATVSFTQYVFTTHVFRKCVKFVSKPWMLDLIVSIPVTNHIHISRKVESFNCSTFPLFALSGFSLSNPDYISCSSNTKRFARMFWFNAISPVTPDRWMRKPFEIMSKMLSEYFWKNSLLRLKDSETISRNTVTSCVKCLRLAPARATRFSSDSETKGPVHSRIGDGFDLCDLTFPLRIVFRDISASTSKASTCPCYRNRLRSNLLSFMCCVQPKNKIKLSRLSANTCVYRLDLHLLAYILSWNVMSKEFKPTGYNSVSPYFVGGGGRTVDNISETIFPVQLKCAGTRTTMVVLRMLSCASMILLLWFRANTNYPVNEFWCTFTYPMFMCNL